MEFLQVEFADNNLLSWLTAGIIGVTTILVATIARALLRAQFERRTTRTGRPIWVAMQAITARTHLLFILLLGLFAGLFVLNIPDDSRDISNMVMTVALLIQGGIWVVAAVKVLLDRYQQKQVSRDPAAATTLGFLSFIATVVIWVVVLLLVLDNLGVNVTALVAGLGIGGIAVALALQNVLGDLFASLSIVLDKPFYVGDFLVVGDMAGTVEHVGLKTTRLHSLSGEQLVFSNSDLLGSRIRNYGRMYERRSLFTLSVTYQTPRDKLARIPQIIQEVIEQQENTRFDRSHFKEYGDSALLFESVYYVNSSVYNEYMDIQQAINLAIFERFAEDGIEFAYPTRTLFVQQT